MSYVVPSVLVYQQLASNAGVANVTPDLDTCIIGPCNNVVVYDSTSVATLLNSAAEDVNGDNAILSNNAVVNTFYLGNRKPGQIVDPSTLQIYFSSASVETKVLHMTGAASTNSLTFAAYTGTAASTAGSPILTNVTNVSQLNPGDIVNVAGAGPASAMLITTIVSISGTSVTVQDAATTTTVGATVTRTSFNNLNSTTSTLRVESGDTVVITYGSTVFTTAVLNIVGVGSTLNGILTTDLLPVGISTPFTVSVRKSYNNLLVPVSLNSHTNYSAANVTIDSSFAINPLPQVAYGVVVSANVYAQYKALRNDLPGLMDIPSIDEQESQLGTASDDNPLALAVSLALANSTGRIRAVAVTSDDLPGYVDALESIQNERVYSIVPLTQRTDILAAVQAHVEQMSTPENAAWRLAIVSTSIPDTVNIGPYSESLVNANGGNNSISLVSGNYVLSASNATFVADDVYPGDIVRISAHSAAAQIVTSVTVLQVLNNQELKVDSPIALTGVSYWVERNLSKAQQADHIAAMSESFSSRRVIHVQPDIVGINVGGVTKYLPGFYACAAISGLVSGLPAQQSLTNVGLAGIADLQHSNRYFTRAQLSVISAAGTCLLVQESAGTIPYIRHSLTTDMTVLQYRELQQMKNIDFLSYFFHDILKGFPGRYNITPDTLQILRTTLVAGAKLLQGKKLPKIGAPLLDYNIKTLKQDEVNKDTVVIEMPVTIPTVANYITLYLIY